MILAWRALGVMGFRRAILFERRLGDAPAGRAPPTPGAELGLLEPGDIGEYLAFHPRATRSELERRLAAGDRCHVARAGGRLAAVRWVAFEEARVPYLEHAFPLAEQEVFIYDAFSDPAWRGRGLSRALFHTMDASLRSEGYVTVLSAVHRENREGMEFTASTSTPVATLVSLGRGRWRHHFRVSRAPRAARRQAA